MKVIFIKIFKLLSLMRSKLFSALMGFLLIGVVLISGCVQQEFSPSVRLDLDKYWITIDDNKISSDFITATIIRLDNENIETIFVLKFPEEKESVFPTDVNGNRIGELYTKPLKGQNSKDILQFKIFGSKGEADESTFTLNVELWFNYTKVVNQDKTITIEVR